MTPYYVDDHVTLHHGDALSTLVRMEAGSVGCIVTSPPYFQLRDYGVPGQLGAEPTPQEFVIALTLVLREARRVLADDGVMFLNLGDSYVDKNLLGIPWRVAFALRDDGWILRNDIVWEKTNAMPESVTDRLSGRHEYVFLLSKSAKYYFDLDAIREPQAEVSVERAKYRRSGHTKDAYGDGWVKTRNPATDAESNARAIAGAGRNPGTVWSIPTSPFPGAHFATMPPALATRCILAGSRPGDVVLDPFSGSGTTGLAATENGRRYVGIDLNREYLELSLRTRLRQGVLDLGVGA
jgi:DNA modification methylase